MTPKVTVTAPRGGIGAPHGGLRHDFIALILTFSHPGEGTPRAT